jgi:hypothetical protein
MVASISKSKNSPKQSLEINNKRTGYTSRRTICCSIMKISAKSTQNSMIELKISKKNSPLSEISQSTTAVHPARIIIAELMAPSRFSWSPSSKSSCINWKLKEIRKSNSPMNTNYSRSKCSNWRKSSPKKIVKSANLK